MKSKGNLNNQVIKSTHLESIELPCDPAIPLSLFFFFFFGLFKVAPAAYGSSQARGLNGATATQDPSRICDPHHSSRQHRILNPVSDARDRTRNLIDASQIPFHCATTGTPETINFEKCIWCVAVQMKPRERETWPSHPLN